MKYDEALRQARIVLDDEFDQDFEIFEWSLAGEFDVTRTLQNWFNASGVKKEECADYLEFAIRNVRNARTDRRALDKASEIIVESGTATVDPATGEYD